MSLWKVKYKIKNSNTWVGKTIYCIEDTFNYTPTEEHSGVIVERIVYFHKHKNPPILIKDLISGRQFLFPSGTEVHELATKKDIIWQQPIITPPKPETETFTVGSSSSDSVYKVTRKGDNWSCNCSGYFRVKDKSKGCKHVQQIKTEHK
jgi:hypothetical protein